MELETIKIVSQVAGIGGISLGVFLILFRDIIRKNIFPKFKSEELSYRLLRLIVIVIWSVAVIGIVSWLYISKGGEKTSSLLPPDWNSYNLISYQDFDSTNKEISCQFNCGNDGVWNMEVLSGKYWVENVTDNSAVHYSFLKNTNLVGDWGKVVDLGPFNPLSVEVTIAKGESEKNQPYSGAGLLFRYRPGSYYLYIINSTGDALLLQFAEGSVSVVFREKIKEFSNNIQYKIGISGDMKNIFLYFNDKFLHSISDSKNISGLGGIVMVGKGRYAFDNLRIYNKIN